MDMQRFASFIAERRHELGLTQQELAKRLNVTDKAISRWENGHGFPDIGTLEPLAEALGVSIVELMKSEKLEDCSISPEAADTALSDAIEMAEEQKKRKSKATALLTVVLTFIAVLVLAAAIREVWAYNNPEIHLGPGMPVKFMFGPPNEPVENWHNLHIVSIGARSRLGYSKTWSIRFYRWHFAGEEYLDKLNEIREKEPYLLMSKVDVVDGEMYFYWLGYYTEDGVTKPVYNLWTFDFVFENISNPDDAFYEFLWEKCPELKEAYEQKMSPNDWLKSRDEVE